VYVVQPANTVADCSRVLAMDSVNVKALFRRALAYKVRILDNACSTLFM
jgi:hypothetical protein